MPFAIGMSGWLYLAAALVLDGIFIAHAWRLLRRYSDRAAQALPLVDHLSVPALRGAAGDHYVG
jgi:heme O synthase-like polyprenyltransferase